MFVKCLRRGRVYLSRFIFPSTTRDSGIVSLVECDFCGSLPKPTFELTYCWVMFDVLIKEMVFYYTSSKTTR